MIAVNLQHVPILKAVIHVLVYKDTREMAEYVLVRMLASNCITYCMR